MPRRRSTRPGAGTEGSASMQAKRYSPKYFRRGIARPSAPLPRRRGTVPGTTTTIDREQRDGLYELVRNHLGQIGDIWIALEQDGEYELAERMGIEFAEDFRLLADIGWQPTDKRTEVELTMEAHDLAELLTRLRGEAVGVLDGTASMHLQREEE